MRYAVWNLGEVEPARYEPAGPADCSNAPEYRRAIDNAAERLAYYNQAIQQAVAAGNDVAVDRIRAAADLANRDWAAWSKALKNCENSPASSSAAAAAAPAGGMAGILALGGIAIVTVAVLTMPQLRSMKFLKTGGK